MKHFPLAPTLPKPGATERDYDRTMYRSLFLALTDIGFQLTSEVAKQDQANIFTLAQVVRLEDALNNSVTNVLTLSHRTTGTPANGIGVGLVFEAETTPGVYKSGASLAAVVTDITAATEDFDLVFKTMANGLLSEIARFSRTTTATHTGLMLWDTDKNVVSRVTVGANDSGGAGFKVLRIPN